MNMYVPIFIKHRVNAELCGKASDKAHGCFRRFLHNIAELSRQLDFAAAVKRKRLAFEHLSADTCPCKPVHKTDLRLFLRKVIRVACCPEIFRYIFVGNGFYRCVSGNGLCGCLPANGGNFALKFAHAGFARVAADYFFNCTGCESDVLFRKSVPFKFFRNKMFFGNRKLFLLGITCHFDYL